MKYLKNSSKSLKKINFTEELPRHIIRNFQEIITTYIYSPFSDINYECAFIMNMDNDEFIHLTTTNEQKSWLNVKAMYQIFPEQEQEYLETISVAKIAARNILEEEFVEHCNIVITYMNSEYHIEVLFFRVEESVLQSDFLDVYVGDVANLEESLIIFKEFFEQEELLDILEHIEAEEPEDQIICDVEL